MFPEYTGNSIFLLPDFTMFRIWNTLPECIRNTCLFPECNWNTVSNFIILRNAPPKYTRNTLEIKKNIKKWPWLLQWILYFFVTQAMPAWACCGSCSAGFPVRLMPPHLEEHDSPSVMGSISGYSERMWKDVKGCERMWKDVKGCETTSGPQEMWC